LFKQSVVAAGHGCYVDSVTQSDLGIRIETDQEVIEPEVGSGLGRQKRRWRAALESIDNTHYP
jgi:hypothetical protein